MTIDDDVLIVRSTKTEVDNAGGDSLAIQGGAQRWKLTSDLLGELNCWEKVGSEYASAYDTFGFRYHDFNVLV